MLDYITLQNGVRVIIKNNVHFNSVSIGIYALVGLIQEPEKLNGISHFLEHMSFKGTVKRSAKRIAEYIDNIGGKLNAHTTKEYTCYYLTVLPQYINEGLDLLSDLYLNSTLSDADLQLEKQVVLEEINMYEDTPDDKIHDIFSSAIWQHNKLGKPIIGSAETLENVTSSDLKSFKANYLNPKNVVVAVAGNIKDPKKLVRKITRLFNFQPADIPSFYEYQLSADSESSVVFEEKKTEQIHFCLGGRGIPFQHDDHYALTTLNTILGGSMSSRLFQKIREKRGYGYAVFSYLSYYKNAGLFTIYAGVNKSKTMQALKIIFQELAFLKEKQVSDSELRKAKEHIKGNMLLSLEKSSSWMSWLARSIIYYDRVIDLQEIVTLVDKVSSQDVNRVASSLYNPANMALAFIGSQKETNLKEVSPALNDFLKQNKVSFE